MSNKEEKKIKVFDTTRFYTGLVISFLICFVATFIIIPMNLSTVFVLIYSLVSLTIIFSYWVHLYKSSYKYVSKNEYREIRKNTTDLFITNELEKQGFNEKEISKILKDRPIGDLLKNRLKSKINNNPLYEVESIEEFLAVCNSSDEEKESLKNYYNMFEKLSFGEKLKSFYGDGPNTFNSLKMDRFDRSAYYDLLRNSIDMSGDFDDLRDLIAEELNKEDKKYFDLDYIETYCLSSSNKNIKTGFYKLTICDGFIYLLNNNYVTDERLRNPTSTSKENYRSLYGEDCYSFKKSIKNKIKVDDIIFYTTDGAIEKFTVTSGGGTSGNIDEIKARIAQRSKGSDSSVLLSGDMAAVYSMLNDIKIDPITTKIVSSDKRVVIIKLKTMDLVFERVTYDYDLNMFLVDKIPDKDLERMNVLKDNSKESKTTSNSNLDEIKKLKELLDMGAITKEEFEKKKKELLK